MADALSNLPALEKRRIPCNRELESIRVIQGRIDQQLSPFGNERCTLILSCWPRKESADFAGLPLNFPFIAKLPINGRIAIGWWGSVN